MLYSQTLFTIAEDYRNRGFYLLAIDIIKEAIKFCADQIIIKNMKLTLADCLRIIKRWDEAIEIYHDIEDYGTIGNITLYLGGYEDSIKWFELVKKRKNYIYYKHPQALFLLEKYLEALDLFCDLYHIETNNTLIENSSLSKAESELVFLCFQKAYNFQDYINLLQEKTISQELINHLNCRIYEINKLTYDKHQGLLRLVINGFGNLPTAIVQLEKISTDKYLVKAKARILKIYQKRIWCLQEINDQNLFSPKGLVHKLVNDENYANEKLREIIDTIQANTKEKPYNNWYDYVDKLNNKGEEINGTDILQYFNYFLPRLTVVQLFEEEVINYIDNRIKIFKTENNETLCGYLAKYLSVPYDFYNKSDAIMHNFFSSISSYLKQTLGLSDQNEKWIKEFAMVKLFYKWFEGFEQITQASPEWLKPQRLDLFIPDLKFAVEYQGEQHFMPIEIFGGEEGFQTRKESDEIKKKLCEANGISLEYINYDEDLLERVKEIYYKFYPLIKEHK